MMPFVYTNNMFILVAYLESPVKQLGMIRIEFFLMSQKLLLLSCSYAQTYMFDRVLKAPL